mmetsp:Transcript_28319/g.61540  ORF Transcript_28319/g.61540 Transcript_28319/m.61540 type:complete len:222 (-) Transcript_28319:184-849(-)
MLLLAASSHAQGEQAISAAALAPKALRGRSAPIAMGVLLPDFLDAPPLPVIPVCIAAHRQQRWVNSRIVGAEGRWAEVECFCEEQSAAFTLLLRWRKGKSASGLWTVPVADWSTDLPILASAGFGRVEWDSPPRVDATQFLQMAQHLRITASQTPNLWHGLMQASRQRCLERHSHSVRHRHSTDLAAEASLTVKLVAQNLPRHWKPRTSRKVTKSKMVEVQ